MIQTLLKMGLPYILDILQKVLLNSTDTTSQNAGKALQQVKTPPSPAEIELALQKTDTQILHTVNSTIKKELSSKDVYVRRMRPTFGYCICFTWVLQMGVLGYLMIIDRQNAIKILSQLDGLGMIWSVGLSVLGVYVYRRSGDKK